MKRIGIHWIILIFLTCLGSGCHEVPVGYLITDYASYNEDSIVIKSELTDLAPGEIVENPNWQMWLDSGLTPEEIMMYFGEYPTMVVGQGEDYLRDLYDIPWVSVPLEGLQGTPPISGHVRLVEALQGNGANVLKECIKVRGDGTIEIPAHHGVSVGKYLISLTFTNEGYSRDLDNCFTVIVQ